MKCATTQCDFNNKSHFALLKCLEINLVSFCYTLAHDRSIMKAAIRDELTCALCQDIFDKPQALIPCLHTFCLDCVNSLPTNYGNDAMTCPICRRRANSFSSNFSIQNFIDIFNNTSLDEAKEIAIISNTAVSSTLNASTSNAEGSSSSSFASTSSSVHDTRAHDEAHQHGEAESSTAAFSTAASSSSSASSYQSVINFGTTKRPCRSCSSLNCTNYTCPIPITDENQDGFGHLLCGYCSEFMPARGFGGNEPAINQCCSFCGVVACDEYWKCRNKSNAAKLYILSDIHDISTWIRDVDSIETKEDGHLNLAEIALLQKHLNRAGISWANAWEQCLIDLDDNLYTSPIVRRMTPLGLEIYNTRRLPVYDNNNHSDGDEDAYYDRIGEEGVLPSMNLRACYSCAVTVVNGQFYGYWKSLKEDGLIGHLDNRDKCTRGTRCDAQWRTPSHASRLSHIETNEDTTAYF
ncbi:hypothetical protein FB192DRAFT_1373444 [Mucor lusitanicus]|uniref:RING-type domain-containing protein n=1 Tax=Mucor circinelloides f. lusitanicus TaxID=29924 RepID=A0A8H4BGE2_MUCCL|nr:hypothetical protein FB192DRAFT_1373444 [Mucor lusitanicus]